MPGCLCELDPMEDGTTTRSYPRALSPAIRVSKRGISAQAAGLLRRDLFTLPVSLPYVYSVHEGWVEFGQHLEHEQSDHRGASPPPLLLPLSRCRRLAGECRAGIFNWPISDRRRRCRLAGEYRAGINWPISDRRRRSRLAGECRAGINWPISDRRRRCRLAGENRAGINWPISDSDHCRHCHCACASGAIDTGR